MDAGRPASAAGSDLGIVSFLPRRRKAQGPIAVELNRNLTLEQRWSALPHPAANCGSNQSPLASPAPGTHEVGGGRRRIAGAQAQRSPWIEGKAPSAPWRGAGMPPFFEPFWGQRLPPLPAAQDAGAGGGES